MIPKFEQAKKDALNFLRKTPTAVIATVSDGAPQASTVYFVANDDFTLYFATQVNTHKYLNLSKDSRVAVVVGTGPSHIQVNIEGTADFAFDDAATAAFMRLVTMTTVNQSEKLPLRDMAKFKGQQARVFKVTPSRVTYMNLDDANHSESVSDRYVTILP